MRALAKRMDGSLLLSISSVVMWLPRNMGMWTRMDLPRSCAYNVEQLLGRTSRPDGTTKAELSDFAVGSNFPKDTLGNENPLDLPICDK